MAFFRSTSLLSNNVTQKSERLEDGIYRAIEVNDKRYRNFRKSLADIENQKGAIDFSILTNAKDVMPDNRVKCPTCYGKGKISKERYLQIKVRKKF